MRYRNLRIAWSAGWSIVAVLLCVLWVRSLSVRDSLRRSNGTTLLNIQSYRGELGIGHWAFPRPMPWTRHVETFEEPAERLWPPMKDLAPLSYLGVRWQTLPPLHLFAVRYWAVVTLSASVVMLPWLTSLAALPRRFSLRTCLLYTSPSPRDS